MKEILCNFWVLLVCKVSSTDLEQKKKTYTSILNVLISPHYPCMVFWVRDVPQVD